MDNKRIAVYGAGSLGTIIGAFLSKAGLDVTLIDVWQENVDTLNTKGAHVVGTTDITVPVKASTPDDIDGKFDIIFLLTKQVFNDSVVPKIKSILNEDGTLVSLQNGVPEKYILTQLPAKNVVAGSVEFGATAQGAGSSELTTFYDRFKEFAFKIGELDGSDTPRIEALKKVMDNVGGTFVSNNLLGTKWSKLLINSAFSGLSAATNSTFGAVADNQVGVLAALNIINEGLEAGKADNVTFDKMGSIDLNDFKKPADGFTDDQIALVRRMMAASKDLKASMLQDLEKGRKTEVHDINGVIVKAGEEHDIKTPFNDFVVSTVSKAEETGKLPVFDESIATLKDMLK
ncbi:ketopantoate reductase family protein [Weissella viridescens]|uniref:ketopantoate reductase family protein n=1 Tax=Weissella viridescens TaxID=1629 RepID=UPI00257718E3|nr:2-dehydropantoate 2-reductase [Weissella viridescens]WJI90977.1 2-dehydropantoate 2-reductase [Weissella viridescens]